MTHSTPAIDEIYWHASQKASPEKRAEYLDEACQGNRSLRQRVERLLELQPQAEQFLEAPKTISMSLDERPVEIVGTVLGHYKLLEQIGHGGMGVVFMAEQLQPVRRKVALKILKPGMDTYEIVGRFEQERQALAIMNHPHIARVFDAGTSPAGRPYFVMELVRGVSITTFCTQKELDSQQRLRLMIQVCHAVQHAHQKGVIHRDLKPSNVMVELHDVTPVPKVIDFGVAKAIHGRLIDRTLFTRYVQMIGTPLYMSPEQTELNGLDADTRSDVYSLGVLLYELLTGSTPFDRQRIRDVGFDEMRRILREEEPPRPSTRISTLNAAGQATQNGPLGGQSLRFTQRLRHELDWVVMKALEKDRTRRYQSAGELAADLQRFLDDEPVLARPPSVTYRLTKLARRHKAILTTIAAVTLALSLGTAISLWQAWRATTAQQLSERRAKLAEQATQSATLQRTLADQARARSEELLYVAEMKLASDAFQNGDIPRAADLLQRHRPVVGGNSDGGFEWRYMNRLVDARPDWTTEIAGRVRRMRLSPDRSLLAIASREGRIYITDPQTGQPLQQFAALAEFNSVSWSPDGARIASTAADGVVRIWDVTVTADSQNSSDATTNSELPSRPNVSSAAHERSFASNFISTLTSRPALTISAHDDETNDALFTPDGKTLITAGDDGLIRQWNAATGDAVSTLKGHTREVEQLALSPDGTRLASASSDDTLRIWDLPNRQQLHSHSPSPGVSRTVCVAFSPDGTLVAAGDISGNLLLFELESQLTAQIRLVDGIESVMFMDAPLRIATGDQAGSVQLWDVVQESGTELQISETPASRWNAHGGRVQALAVDKLRRRLFSGSRDGTIAAWPTESTSPRWSCGYGKDFCITSGNELLACANEVLRFDMAQRRLTNAALPSPDGWELIVKSRDTSRIAIATKSMIVVHDMQKQQEIFCQDFDAKIHRLTISPDGTQVAVAWWGQRKSIEVINVDDPQAALVLAAVQCNSLEFSPDSRRLAAGNMDDVLVYDLWNSHPPLRLSGHDSALNDVAFSSDHVLIATVGDDRNLMLWDARTGTRLAYVQAHRDNVNSVTFSPDQRSIATAGKDGVVRLWHIDTLQPLLTLALPNKKPGDRVEFTPDGTRLVTLTDDFQVIVFDPTVPSLAEQPVTSETSAVPPDTTAAGQPLFLGLADFPGGTFNSRAHAVSCDGRHVVGFGHTADGFDAFIWTYETGLQRLGPPRPDAGNSEATSVSDDGSIICGAGKARGVRGHGARIWPTVDQTRRLVDVNSAAADISGDGSVVVGKGRENDLWFAFRWTSDGQQTLPATSDRPHAVAHAVTPDGRIALGTVFDHAKKPEGGYVDFMHWRNARPAIWKNDVLQPLSGFDENHNWCAWDISDDGTVLVGTRWPQGESMNSPEARGFIWRAGQLTLLEPLAGYRLSNAFGISGDGRVVVGVCESVSNEGAVFVWDAEHGMRNLDQLLAREGQALGWRLFHAQSISRDGSTIVGSGYNPDGHTEAWRLRIPHEILKP